jgi:hypothetical protein
MLTLTIQSTSITPLRAVQTVLDGRFHDDRVNLKETVWGTVSYFYF